MIDATFGPRVAHREHEFYKAIELWPVAFGEFLSRFCLRLG